MTPEPVMGDKVVLRPWNPEEATLYIALRDADVFRFTTEDGSLDPATCRDNIRSARADPDRAPFAISGGSKAPVGNLDVRRVGRKAAISYWLTAEARGRGWASDALRTASSWAEKTWDLEHLELEINTDNQASMAVAEAAGYRRHGIRLESSCGGPAVLFRRSPAATPDRP